MRAVNLIPEDERKGGGAGVAGRSGGVVYLLLGGLAAMVAMAGTWAVTSHGLSGKRAELGALQRETAAASARIAGTQGPVDLAARRRSQSDTVRGLLAGRHDWAGTLDAIGRTLPANTTLTSLETSATAAASGATASAAAVPTGPGVELSGCAPSQRAVARLMPRLRTIPGVQTVTLVSSTLGGAATGGGSSSSASACVGATFQMTLGLEGAASAGALPAGTAQAPAGQTPAPAPTTAATPPAQNTAAPAPAAAAPAATPPATGAAQTAVPGTPTSAGKP